MAGTSSAPGDLEQIRTFLNTWRLPHETRSPADDLPVLMTRSADWRAAMPDIPRPRPQELDELLALRTDLRTTLGRSAPTGLREWFQRHPVHVTVGDETRTLQYRPDTHNAAATIMAMVAAALAGQQWARLKSCPDCRNVFYDHSRNRSRTWCSMYAETSDGRACGSIAKVRAYRKRRRGD
ncbi:CGNR zinc finger domain-containing protein [Nocardia sp. CY41]|uniref:CGNR zinc finger domain-containing protein n=1 Tax=Nocardia sp. CY41 TaxID=2608686 RepID=UPI00135CD4DD|nr:CGNR zinc finger domain-containing protein [Nocardia sp. CY41]